MFAHLYHLQPGLTALLVPCLPRCGVCQPYLGLPAFRQRPCLAGGCPRRAGFNCIEAAMRFLPRRWVLPCMAGLRLGRGGMRRGH